MQFWQNLLKSNPFLAWIGVLHLIAFFIVLGLIPFDDRTLMGINVWIKPSKFLISIVLLVWTLAWYLAIFPYQNTTKKRMAGIVGGLLFIESILIVFQAARGELSHYNMNDALGGIIYALMGILVFIIFLVFAKMTIDSFRLQLQANTAMTLGIRWALVTVMLGSIGGILMSLQLHHAIGVADGGLGLPYVNWSVEGGDLRVMHFLGLHALQIIPLGVWAIQKLAGNISLSQQNNLSFVLGMGYFLLTLAVFVQALLGMPLVRL